MSGASVHGRFSTIVLANYILVRLEHNGRPPKSQLREISNKSPRLGHRLTQLFFLSTILLLTNSKGAAGQIGSPF